MKLSELRQAKIDTHAGTGTGHERHMAINVKYHGPWPDASEGAVTAAWDQTRAGFWEEATEIARRHGYDYLFSEGRSGGWMVPFYQPAARRMHAYSWPGQGGSVGYPRYPDAANLADRAVFLAFRSEIEAMLADVPRRFAENAATLDGRIIDDCAYCHARIVFDADETGGIHDWGADGDYGCSLHPLSGDDGCWGHQPASRSGVALTDLARWTWETTAEGGENVAAYRAAFDAARERIA